MIDIPEKTIVVPFDSYSQPHKVGYKFCCYCCGVLNAILFLWCMVGYIVFAGEKCQSRTSRDSTITSKHVSQDSRCCEQ